MNLCWCHLFTLIVAITVKSSLQTTKCPPLHLTNGRVRLRAVGRMATFRCDPKFRIVGARHAVCLSSGMWNFQKTPMCLGTECPQIDVLVGGTIKELYNGSMLEFECALELRLEGSQRIVCLGTSWDSAPPTCISDIVLPLNNTGCDHEDQRLCAQTDDRDYDANWTSTQGSREHTSSENKTYSVSPVNMTGCDYEDQRLCPQVDDSDYDANWTRTQVDTVTPSLNNASYSADLVSPPNIIECEYEDQSLCTWTDDGDYDVNSTSIQDGRPSSELNSTSDSVNITGCDYEDQSLCTWTDNRTYDLNWTSSQDGMAISESINTTVSDLSALVSPVNMTGCDYEDQRLCAKIDDSDYDSNWTRTQVDTVMPSLNNASYSADLVSPPNITECEYEDQSLCTWIDYDYYDVNSTSIQDGRPSSELNNTSDSVNITGCDYEDQSLCTWTDNRTYDLNWTSSQDGMAISESVNTTVSVLGNKN